MVMGACWGDGERLTNAGALLADEALVNALIHRSYLELGAEVHVDVYDDCLTISSPGEMMKGPLPEDVVETRVESFVDILRFQQKGATRLRLAGDLSGNGGGGCLPSRVQAAVRKRVRNLPRHIA